MYTVYIYIHYTPCTLYTIIYLFKMMMFLHKIGAPPAGSISLAQPEDNALLPSSGNIVTNGVVKKIGHP